MCTFQLTTSAQGFLFKCTLYDTIRQEIFGYELLDKNTHDLLFGKPTLSEEENTLLFEKVHKYIIQTKRFV